MTDRHTRRRLLAATGGGLAAGLAGCLGVFGGGGTGGGDGKLANLDAPTLGDADVVVAAYEDFACPHCRHFSLEVLPTVVSEYVDPGAAEFHHNDFPIPVSKWSWRAASAARAVQKAQGDQAFFEYAHGVFENQSSLSYDTLASLAGNVGADPETVRAAAKDQRYREVVQQDREAGMNKGVRATPTVFVDGKKVQATADAIGRAISNAQ